MAFAYLCEGITIKEMKGMGEIRVEIRDKVCLYFIIIIIILLGFLVESYPHIIEAILFLFAMWMREERQHKDMGETSSCTFLKVFYLYILDFL